MSQAWKIASPEDFDQILTEVQTNIVASIKAAIDNAVKVEPSTDRIYWRGRKEAIRVIPLVFGKGLSAVDWSRRGNLRGLTAAVEQLRGGPRPDQVIGAADLQGSGLSMGSQSNSLTCLPQLAGSSHGRGRSCGNVKRLEVDQRMALRQQLLADLPARRLLAQSSQYDEACLVGQVHQLDADAKRAKNGQET